MLSPAVLAPATPAALDGHPADIQHLLLAINAALQNLVRQCKAHPFGEGLAQPVGATESCP